MEEARFEDMGAYVLKRHNTVGQYTMTRPILETVRRSGAWVKRRWWDQEGLKVEGERVATAAAKDWEGGFEGGE